MNKKIIILISGITLTVCSCHQPKQAENVDIQEESVEVNTENVLHVESPLHIVDTVKSGSNIYIVTIDRTPCDTTNFVVDEYEQRYVDNTIRIEVRKNASVLFARTFRKSDFAHLLTEDFIKNSVLDGCRFLQVHEGTVSFTLAVSYPDSDMYRPFKLNIGPDGSHMILVDDDLDEEYNTDSLSFEGV